MNVVRSAGGNDANGSNFRREYENTATAQSIIRPSCTINELMGRTRFSKDEIRHLYRTFKQDCPSGEVSKAYFASVLATLFPTGECFRYSTLLFQNIDRANKGVFRFEDLLGTLSILLRGSNEDRLGWIFDLYDLNKDGMLTRTELLQTVASIFQLIAPVCKEKLPSITTAIEQRTDQLFQNWDVHGRGVVYKEDFLRYCLQDAMIRRSLDLFKLNV